MTNAELKKMFKKEGIFMWQIAQKIGVHEMTLSRMFRNELSEQRQKELLAAVEQIKIDRCKEQGTQMTQKKNMDDVPF